MIKNIKFIIIVLFSLFIFFILLKGLEKPNNYLPENTLRKIETKISIKKLHDQEEVLLGELIDNNNFSIINIWASWCLPCRDEHSLLLILGKNEQLEVIGLNYKDNLENAKQFISELGNPYRKIFVDRDGTKAIELGAFGVPESFLIYENKIIKKYIGPLNVDLIREIEKIIE